MAHASCPSGHGMWNGNGKPVVWAFRVGYIREFVKEHPDCILSDDGYYWQMYDLLMMLLGKIRIAGIAMNVKDSQFL